MRHPPSVVSGSFVSALVIVLAASCAGSSATTPTRAPAAASAAAPAAARDATPVVQIYDVTDLVTPPGETSPDTDRTEKLADELRGSLTFVGGEEADEVELTALGGQLVVRATRGVHAQIHAALARRRANAAAGGR